MRYFSKPDSSRKSQVLSLDFDLVQEVQDQLGRWVTKEMIREAGYRLVRGKKRGNQGGLGYFAEPAVLSQATLTRNKQ